MPGDFDHNWLYSPFPGSTANSGPRCPQCGVVALTTIDGLCRRCYAAQFPAQGWECPRCRVIHAPSVESCKCS